MPVSSVCVRAPLTATALSHSHPVFAYPMMFGPNISGATAARDLINAYNGLDVYQTGVFFWNQKNSKGALSGGVHTDAGGTLNLDASRVSSVFGASTTVQPASLWLLPCIKS